MREPTGIRLQTPRLLLRPFEHDDLHALSEILADPEVMRFSINGPMSREESETALQRNRESLLADGTGHMAIFHLGDQKLIGFCGVKLQEIDGRPQFEIGYRLAREYWGQGLATEAAKAVLDYAIGELDLRRLIAIIDPENIASRRVALKLGMMLEKNSLFHGQDVQIYAWESPTP